MKIGDLTEEKQRELERIFTQLDQDQDGHLNFDVLEKKYCTYLNECQRSFFYQVKIKKLKIFFLYFYKKKSYLKKESLLIISEKRFTVTSRFKYPRVKSATRNII